MSLASDDVNDALGAAYEGKYSRYPSHIDRMVASQARTTTLKLVPRECAVRS